MADTCIDFVYNDLAYKKKQNKKEEKLKTSKPIFTGKEVKINKDTCNTLYNFMNTLKRIIKDLPRNQTLFKGLIDYTKSYKN